MVRILQNVLYVMKVMDITNLLQVMRALVFYVLRDIKVIVRPIHVLVKFIDYNFNDILNINFSKTNIFLIIKACGARQYGTQSTYWGCTGNYIKFISYQILINNLNRLSF
jgi:hypothetical protein